MIDRKWILTVLAAAATSLPVAAEPALRPYVATYSVSYSSLSVGQSRVELKPGDGPGAWNMESRSTAQGLARLVVGGALAQRSWFQVEGSAVRPLRYRFDDGSDGDKNVSLDFDWAAGRVTGIAEGKAVAVDAPAGLQDSLSLQVMAMLVLQAEGKLESLAMIEREGVKHYRYVFERREAIDTPLGRLDTLVYRSERPGSKRYSRLWYAPSLGYLNVKAEQFRESKRLFSLQIKTYRAQ